MKKIALLVLCLGTLFVFTALATEAAALSAGEYKFSGVVSQVPTELASEFIEGEPISGTMSLTLSQKLPIGSYELAYYNIANFHANFGGDYLLASPSGVFTIINFDAGSDYVKVEVSSPSGMTGPTVAGHSAEYFSSNLFYEDGMLTSTNLIREFIAPGFLFDVSGFRFDGNDSLSVRFRFTEISLVPEPVAADLAAIGLIAAPFSKSLLRRRCFYPLKNTVLAGAHACARGSASPRSAPAP